MREEKEKKSTIQKLERGKETTNREQRLWLENKTQLLWQTRRLNGKWFNEPTELYSNDGAKQPKTTGNTQLVRNQKKNNYKK